MRRHLRFLIPVVGILASSCTHGDSPLAPPTSTRSNSAAAVQASEFTVVVLPDAQAYSEYDPATFNAQTQWIADNRAALNIVFVTQGGDLVDDPASDTEWLRASGAMGNLDGLVPYGIAIGNHDIDDSRNLQPTAKARKFREYFPVSRFESQPSWGGYYDPADVTRNTSYQRLSVGSLEFLFLQLEWEAPDDVLAWAAGVLAAHPDHRVIVTTHDYLTPWETPAPQRTTSWPRARIGANYGEDIWQELIRSQPTVFMVLSSHFFGEVRQTSLNDFGRPVYEIMANYHNGSVQESGDGWLRYYVFKPALNEIHAFTYSPTLDLYDTDAASRFVLPYDMGGVPAEDLEPPTAPASVTATAVSPFRIDLAWTASTDNVGVAGYEVDRDGSPLVTVAGTTYSDDGLEPGTTYVYRITAFDAAGNESPPSGATSATTLPLDTQPPTTPTNLVAVDVSSSRVDLAWDPSTDDVGVTAYRVYRDGDPLGAVPVTSYADQGVEANTTYAYEVSAVDAAGNESPRSATLSVTTPAGPAPGAPAAPADLVWTVVGGRKNVRVTWAPVAGADCYRVTGDFTAITVDCWGGPLGTQAPRTDVVFLDSQITTGDQVCIASQDITTFPGTAITGPARCECHLEDRGEGPCN